MPEYLSPGVYVEEFEIGPKPIEGVGTSTAGFLGMTERGPLKPRLVTSYSQFANLYEGFIKDSLTAYAVEGFFKNGGQRCFIGRVARAGADEAELANPLSVKTVGPGAFGNRAAIRIENASSGDANLFKLMVAYWSGTLPDLAEAGADDEEIAKNLRDLLESADKLEVFDNLSFEEKSADNVIKKVNGISTLIEIPEDTVIDARPANTAGAFMVALAGGNDGAENLTRSDMRGNPAAVPGKRTGLTAFSEVDEIAILYAPDMYSPIFTAGGRQSLVDDILTQCEILKDRFAILDIPESSSVISDLSISTAPLRPSKYGAVYYPWIKVLDPLTRRKKSIPPGGYMAGIYARSDNERGVHKAPANEIVRGALDLEFQITKGEQDILNPRHINCIRFFPGRGIRVWGARTTILDSLWKYINVRRLFIYIEESIEEGTQWVVFEPNDHRLWDRVIQTITQFLTRVWKDGALMGTTPEEAFFVKCDRNTMTQDDIDNGRLICVIGIAPVKPAEFVIFRIAQWQGGSAVTE
ncbi:MAG: phage tail sheath family protein [bacterium]|nr:phage tail sheath family protein [bacterium]